MPNMKYDLSDFSYLLIAFCIASSGFCKVVSAATALYPDHAHLPIEVPARAPLPGLSLKLSRDAIDGFNLQVLTENFTLGAPPVAKSLAELTGLARDVDTGFMLGHGHLYINGQKLQRLYGTRVHLPSALFFGGVNQVTVTLNNHGHRYWAIDGRQILATLFINPKAESLVVYRFDSFPVAASKIE